MSLQQVAGYRAPEDFKLVLQLHYRGDENNKTYVKIIISKPSILLLENTFQNSKNLRIIHDQRKKFQKRWLKIFTLYFMKTVHDVYVGCSETLPIWCSMSLTLKDDGGRVMPKPSLLSTITGTLNECSSRNSTVSCTPDGLSKISSALQRQKNIKKEINEHRVFYNLSAVQPIFYAKFNM